MDKCLLICCSLVHLVLHVLQDLILDPQGAFTHVNLGWKFAFFYAAVDKGLFDASHLHDVVDVDEFHC